MPRVLPRQKPYRKHLTATRFAKTKTLPQAPASAPRILLRQKPSHKHQAPASMPRVLQRQKPYRKHLRHRHAFCQDKNLATSTCVSATHFAKTKTFPQAPSTCVNAARFAKTKPYRKHLRHRHAFCQDKNLTASICVTATRFAKTKTLPQAPASAPRILLRQKPSHKHQAPASMPRVLPRQKPYRKHLRHRHAFCQDKNLATSTCVSATHFAKTKTFPQAPASAPRILLRQKPSHKHQAPASMPRVLPRQKPYCKHLRHRHAFCQDKNLATSTCVSATHFAKTKTFPQAPASAPRILLRQKPSHKHQAPASMPRVLPRQKPYRKHLRHRHAFCQDKNLATSTCVSATHFAKTKPSHKHQAPASMPRILPRQKPYRKHLRHRHAFCQDKNLATSTCVSATHFAKTKTFPQAPASAPRILLRQKPSHKHQAPASMPRVLQRQKPYRKHLRHRHAFCQDKNLATSTCVSATHFAKTKTFPQAPSTCVNAARFAKTKTLPQASHRHAFCQDKNLATSTCVSATHFAKTKTFPQAPSTCVNAARFAKTKTLPQASASPPHVLPRQKPCHKHLRQCHVFCQDKNLTASICVTATRFAKTKNLEITKLRSPC